MNIRELNSYRWASLLASMGALMVMLVIQDPYTIMICRQFAIASAAICVATVLLISAVKAVVDEMKKEIAKLKLRPKPCIPESKPLSDDAIWVFVAFDKLTGAYLCHSKEYPDVKCMSWVETRSEDDVEKYIRHQKEMQECIRRYSGLS